MSSDRPTCARANDDASMPMLASAPPSSAVRRSPNESIRIPASGETKKVIPMESDPTRAVGVSPTRNSNSNDRIYTKLLLRHFLQSNQYLSLGQFVCDIKTEQF